MRSAWRVAVGVVVLGLASARCGSSTPTGAGNTAADAGGGGSAGADAGPVADGGAGGSPADGGSGGGGSADGGNGGGGSADAGSGGGGAADAGSGGGGVAAGCQGVVPDRLNGSFSFEVPGFDFPGANWTCEGDTTDERGNVASHVAFGPNYPDQRWHLFDTNGAHRAGFYAIDLLPQGEGFEGIYEVAGNIVPSFNVGLWSPDGTRGDGPAVGGEIVPSGVRAWPNGILTVNGACHNTTSGVQEFLTLRRFDVGRNELAQMSLTFKCVGLAGVVEDANDNRLVLAHALAADGFGTSDLLGYWFDSGGHPLTGWFSVGPGGGAGHTYTVRALIGGGAAVRIDGAWTYFIPSGKAESQTAPPFLAGNPDTDFTLVRGATAYAVLPRAGDTTRMKLYSRGGDLCGTLTFPSGGLTTGADGSVIASSGPRGCTKTVWPALLR